MATANPDSRGIGEAQDKGHFDTLGELLDAVEEEAEDSGSMSIGQIQSMAGPRSYGPLLLLPGLVAITPISGIPTVPSIIGAIVAIVSAQLLFGRRRVWLPARLRDAALEQEKLARGMRFARPIARAVDRVVHRRLPALTGRLALRVAAAVCLLVGASMPPLEIVPFMATSAGIIIAFYGLALTVHDGVLIIAAHAITAAVAIGGLAVVGG